MLNPFASAKDSKSSLASLVTEMLSACLRLPVVDIYAPPLIKILSYVPILTHKSAHLCKHAYILVRILGVIYAQIYAVGLMAKGEAIMSDKVYIYGLEDPRVRKFFYIGSSINPGKRFGEHMRSKSTDVTPIINELGALGLSPLLIIVEGVPLYERRSSEHTWMRHYKDLGHPLVNRKIPQHVTPRGVQMATMNVSVPQGMVEHISEEASRRGITRSEYVRELLQSALNRQLTRLQKRSNAKCMPQGERGLV